MVYTKRKKPGIATGLFPVFVLASEKPDISTGFLTYSDGGSSDGSRDETELDQAVLGVVEGAVVCLDDRVADDLDVLRRGLAGLGHDGRFDALLDGDVAVSDEELEHFDRVADEAEEATGAAVDTALAGTLDAQTTGGADVELESVAAVGRLESEAEASRLGLARVAGARGGGGDDLLSAALGLAPGDALGGTAELEATAALALLGFEASGVLPQLFEVHLRDLLLRGRRNGGGARRGGGGSCAGQGELGGNAAGAGGDGRQGGGGFGLHGYLRWSDAVALDRCWFVSTANCGADIPLDPVRRFRFLLSEKNGRDSLSLPCCLNPAPGGQAARSK